MSRGYLIHRWTLLVLLFGLYLTVRGYHSRDGDQAYRLPILLHQQSPELFANDPFVTAFDTFNPHLGYLRVLNSTSRLLGLSFALFALFTTTFALTCFGIDRLARVVWPECQHSVGGIAIVLVLLAKAGNIGTNHLFEAMLLDRLIGFALGWLAIAFAIEGKPIRTSLLIGLAALIHPTVGLQLGALLCASWVGWALLRHGTGLTWQSAWLGIATLGVALLPVILGALGQSRKLFDGLSIEEFRLIGVELQMAQHMVPSFWRNSQWMAWGSYLILGAISLGMSSVRAVPSTKLIASRSCEASESRARFLVLSGILLIGLALAYLTIELIGNIRVTIFQPFRMATIARGLALIALAGRCHLLWGRGDWLSRSRVYLLAAGLAGDWSFVVAMAVECMATLVETRRDVSRLTGVFLITLTFLAGMIFLYRHDTEQGERILLSAVVVSIVLHLFQRKLREGWTGRRLIVASIALWVLPTVAFVAPILLPSSHPLVVSLAARCRFFATPVDDVERLADWCRTQTPTNARFITPPGPKTFRLWSLRSVAFNRAASPYHASGLKDWYERFRAHVCFQGTTADFVRAYLTDRHGIESRYLRLNARQLAELARSQGADHVLTVASVKDSEDRFGPLELLKTEGRYAIYRVNPSGLADRRVDGRLR